MKTLDDPTNWETACKMVFELAVRDSDNKRPRKTASTLIDFTLRELNTTELRYTSGQAKALATIYGAIRYGQNWSTRKIK